MSGFDAGWLALREPADRAARAAHLVARAGADLAAHAAPVVCDLGAGTGASVRAFGDAFPPDTRWCLVDDDADVLAEARRLCGPVEVRRADLAADPAAWGAECRLVTATALFDLAAPAWIEALADRLAADRLPLLACLSYDGRLRIAPPDPLDAAVHAGFDADQRRDKGLGGPAAGPEAAGVLARALTARGYRVETADSPWVLEPEAHAALIAALVAGFADAAAQAGALPATEARAWAAARAGTARRVTVGHLDLYAVPPDR